MGASTLQDVSRGMTPIVARTLAKRGLVRPLLQVSSPASSPLSHLLCQTALCFSRWRVSLPPVSACRVLYRAQQSKYSLLHRCCLADPPACTL